MNLFKVLASGKKSFQEETASALLAWFLNPTMEHGLGYSFLSKFIENISAGLDNSELSDLANRLTPKLRGEYENLLKLWFNIEYHVDNAFIDIVIGIDDWIIGIENKIYATSVSAKQLQREYDGLKQKNPDAKIGMVYLVPCDENAYLIDAKTQKEFNGFSTRNDDFKALVTWQKNKIGQTPSIFEIIRNILHEESMGKIDPVADYTRHTLKALISFISNDFSGYDYDRDNKSAGGMNPLTQARLTPKELSNKNSGYVGVKGGIKGLLKMDRTTIKNYKFQYTSQDMSSKLYWIDINSFNNIISWILDRKVESIDWKGKFPVQDIFAIAKDFGKQVFIGVKGGENALEAMGKDEIIGKEWQIDTVKANAQWIDGSTFYDIISQKNI